VKAFLDRGYNVVANSRNLTKANPLPASANLALVDGDIGDPKTAAKIVDTAVFRFGRVDVLINNAARLAAKDLVTDEGVNGSHPERAAVVAFRGPILSRELQPAALSSDGRKKSRLLGTFPVYRCL